MAETPTALARRLSDGETTGIIQYNAPLAAAEIVSRVQLIRNICKDVMQTDVHYGKVPGTDRDCLLKPGAEILLMTFRLSPKVRIKERNLPNGHREYTVKCIAMDNHGNTCGEGVGFASTMEKKYRWRTGERKCPQCGQPSVRKSRNDPGWYCWSKIGGCGAKWSSDNEPAIVNQDVGRVENPDLADMYNTVLKMAKKRALVDCAITACAASEIFTQDIDEGEPPHDAPADPPQSRPPTNGTNGAGRSAARPTQSANPPPRSAPQSQPPTQKRDLRAEARELVKKVGVKEADRICRDEFGVKEMREMLAQTEGTFTAYVDRLKKRSTELAGAGA